MWTFGVVVLTPAFDDDARLRKAVEDLAVQEFVSKLGVEALAVPVLLRAARLNECGPGADRRDPLANGFSDELGTVVGADVLRHSAQDEEIRQHVDDVGGLQLPVDPDGEALPGELVDQIEHTELTAVMGSTLDEVVGPHVVRPLWTKPDAGPVVQPEPPALGLLGWHLQAFLTPDALDALHVDHPPGISQQGCDPAPISDCEQSLVGQRDTRNAHTVLPAR